MSRLRPFRSTDLFAFNAVNLDHFTETYSCSYYLNYLALWPELCFLAETPHAAQLSSSSTSTSTSTPTPTPTAYLIGKAEGTRKELHGHVTAITVSPHYRRLGLAKSLMSLLESASSSLYSAWFVDLFVRPSNALAVGLYEALEYGVYRRVREYYAGGGGKGGAEDEDGFDMRKALPRDTKRETIRPSEKGIKTFVDVHATIFEPTYRLSPR
ncbi:acyl-CoA N-acyltransferase [Jaminaea rosea]|uniref:Acyl-CoA N-acyltransferase n=1 Tax=Jaminaea rosea TaxID=1569628 RepID=A0A316UMU2_9BASI|nr:acyl-CoA N-acyltransferase [Jaminaea rosea]PWN25681.1 acyl-CoA N-acyltransferase [Jaminaea rosea]